MMASASTETQDLVALLGHPKAASFCLTGPGSKADSRWGCGRPSGQGAGEAPWDIASIAASIATTASSGVRRAVSTTSLGEVHGT